MSAILYGQHLLRPLLSFLNLYDLDETVLVNKEWNRIGNTVVNARMASLREAFRTLQLPSGTRCRSISLVGDESNVKQSFEWFAKMEKVFRGVHMGASCFANWDYAVAMRSRFVILLDDDVDASQLNDLAIQLMRVSNTPEDFQAAFFKKFDKIKHFNRDTRVKSKKQFAAWKQETYSAFVAEKGFSYIKKLVDQDRIVTVTCALGNEQVIPQIAEIVHRAGLTFTSLYLSTKFEYVISWGVVYPEPKEKFISRQTACRTTLEWLKNDKTCIVDAVSDGPGFGTFFRRIYLGKDSHYMHVLFNGKE